MTTLEIDEICRKYCEDHGATPACLGYEGFPMSVCTSINEVVCHGIPKKEDVLKEGDIITALDKYPTLSTAQLQEAVTKFSPGDKVKVSYVRDGNKETTVVTLRNSSGNTGLTRADNSSSLGATLKAVDEETARRLEISGGVSVGKLTDGRFKDNGIKDDFIILSINNSRVTSADDVEKIYNAVRKSADRDKVMFIIGLYPDGRQAYYAVPLND